ncbi:33 kDa chaperonin [Amylibacter marinus]|uniref:33 kDa chaperonin n=1 Tax=Amylibacter marinus TaxID=1475483 RepID=A0ABQ5VVT8_9RHOB|nr:Hsp33 family molecular chaperone HslO [Amylibacter marinus]GLQ35380.1 33 kDa chaperonin [Amylibacter marinus]
MTQEINFEGWDELVLPFQLDASNVRGRAARLDSLLNEILAQHDYPQQVSALVAEAVMLTALIGQAIKQQWKLSLQIRGDGPIRIIATDYYGPSEDGQPAKIRAYASYDKDRLDASPETGFANIGKGMFAVLMDQGAHMQPYQGITSLDGESLSACAETYFQQSEQLPTKFKIITGLSAQPGQQDTWRAGGVMIQHLPKASPHKSGAPISFDTEEEQSPETLAEDWNRVGILLESVEELELIGPNVTPPQLLHRLFHEETPRVYDPQVVKFGCTCGEDKVRQSMSIYSQKDISKMLAPNGMVTADCQFCGAHYELEPKTLGFEGVEN